MHDEESRLLAKVRAALDDGVARLDGSTRSRLAQARTRALEPHRIAWRWWLPAGGAVFASLLAAVIWLGQSAPVPDNGFSAVADLELLTSGDNLDLYQELDFYRWLEEEGVHAG